MGYNKENFKRIRTEYETKAFAAQEECSFYWPMEWTCASRPQQLLRSRQPQLRQQEFASAILGS